MAGSKSLGLRAVTGMIYICFTNLEASLTVCSYSCLRAVTRTRRARLDALDYTSRQANTAVPHSDQGKATLDMDIFLLIFLTSGMVVNGAETRLRSSRSPASLVKPITGSLTLSAGQWGRRSVVGKQVAM